MLRHRGNKKWYGAVLDVDGAKIGLKNAGTVYLLNLKCPPMLIDDFVEHDGYFRAYHMNKTHWISILLGGPASDDDIKDLISVSYSLTGPKNRKK